MTNRLIPAWDHFPMPLSVVSPVSLQINMICWGDLPKCLSLLKTGCICTAYMRTRLAQSLDLELKSQHRLLQASPSDMATPLLHSHGLGQICTPNLLINLLIKPACHHNSFWGSRCDSKQAPTISLKPCIISQRFRLIPFDTHTSSHRLFHHF